MDIKKTFMLKDLLNWEIILQQPRYAGGHQEIMESLFAGSSAILASYSDGGYQGQVGYIYLVYFGTDYSKIVIITDYYGSCGGCDSWEDADDDDVREMCTALANDARTFDEIDEAIEFLKTDAVEEAGNYGYRSTASGMLEELEKTKKKIASGDFNIFT